MKKFLLYSKNIYSNKYLDKAKNYKKRLYHYLIYLAIGLMTLFIALTIKMLLAATKKKGYKPLTTNYKEE